MSHGPFVATKRLPALAPGIGSCSEFNLVGPPTYEGPRVFPSSLVLALPPATPSSVCGVALKTGTAATVQYCPLEV